MTSRRAGLAWAAVLAASGCGSASPPPAPPATLPPAAVAYLPSHVSTLTAAGLAHEAGTPPLRKWLSDWGFVAGAERYFQGESRQLQVVDSRALRFSTTSGARAFIAFVGRHVSVYLGSFPRIHPLRSGGRGGILAVAQPCQCHLANPAYLAVLARGSTITWLEINGPGATRRKLVALLDRTP